MKKLFAILLAVSFLFCGCGTDGGAEPDVSADPEPEYIPEVIDYDDDDDTAPDDYRPMICWNGRLYFDGFGSKAELPNGWVYAGNITSEVEHYHAVPEEDGSANFDAIGSSVYTNPDDPDRIYLGIPDAYALWCTADAMTERMTLIELDEWYAEDDLTFGVLPNTVTPTYALFRLTNTKSETIYIGMYHEIIAVIGQTPYRIAIPSADIMTGIYTVEPGESVDIALDWSRSYGELPDGTYILYMFNDGVPFGASFSIGSGIFNMGALDIISNEPVTVPDTSLDDPLTGQIEEVSTLEIAKLDDLYITVDQNSIREDGMTVSYVNERNETVMYGTNYHIEKLADDEWHWIHANEHVGFPMTSWYLEPGETYVEYVYWADIYGGLPDGEYRIVKGFYINGENDLVNVACEFTVEREGKSAEPGDITRWTGTPDIVDGLAVSVVPESLTAQGLQLEITNLRETYVDYGEEYAVWKKVGSRWYQLKMLNIIDVTDLAYILEPGDSVTLTIDWSRVYGELPEGEYCIVKTFFSEDRPFSNNSPQTNDTYQRATGAAEFSISFSTDR